VIETRWNEAPAACAHNKAAAANRKRSADDLELLAIFDSG
jgi:hypothetical protein